MELYMNKTTQLRCPKCEKEGQVSWAVKTKKLFKCDRCFSKYGSEASINEVRKDLGLDELK